MFSTKNIKFSNFITVFLEYRLAIDRLFLLKTEKKRQSLLTLVPALKARRRLKIFAQDLTKSIPWLLLRFKWYPGRVFGADSKRGCIYFFRTGRSERNQLLAFAFSHTFPCRENRLICRISFSLRLVRTKIRSGHTTKWYFTTQLGQRPRFREASIHASYT